MPFELLQSISIQGSHGRPNDDRVGADGTRAWVIDGATDLAAPGLLGAQGGAAWLAAALSTEYAAADDADLTATCRAVFARVEARYHRERTREPVAAWEIPKAAFAAVHLIGSTLQVAWSADCAVLLGTHWCTPAPDSSTEAAAARALGAGPERTAQVLADRRSHRAQPEHEAIRPDAAGAFAATRFIQTQVAPGDHLLLMSDGMSCLVSDYARYDAESLMQAALTRGLAELVTEIRQIEAEDADCTRYPRFKVSDDASAILLRISGGSAP